MKKCCRPLTSVSKPLTLFSSCSSHSEKKRLKLPLLWTLMQDAEVPLRPTETGQSAGRGGQKPPGRVTGQQLSDRSPSRLPPSPPPSRQPRPPQPSQLPPALHPLQGSLQETGPVSSSEPIKELKEHVRKIKQNVHYCFPSLSHFCSFPPTLDKKQQLRRVSCSAAWRIVAVTTLSLSPAGSQAQLQGRPSLFLSPPTPFHLTGTINNPGSWCSQLRTKLQFAWNSQATPCSGHFFVFFSCFSSTWVGCFFFQAGE